jgi:hypothetical protein
MLSLNSCSITSLDSQLLQLSSVLLSLNYCVVFFVDSSFAAVHYVLMLSLN